MRHRLFAVGLAALASAGCGGSDPAAVPPTTTADSTSTPASVAGSTSTTAAPPPEPATASDALADGRHAGYLKGVDEGKRTVVVDVVQFLTGDAAKKAAAEDGKGADVPHDFYIRNVNARLRTLSLGEGVAVSVLDAALGGSDAARLVEADVSALARIVRHNVAAGSAEANPYWLTVAGGRVTKVEQQYLP